MSWPRKLLKYGFVLALLGALLAAAATIGAYYYIKPNLPDIEELRKIQLQVPISGRLGFM